MKNEEQFYKEQFFKAIDERFDSLDCQLKEIKDNHLAHIYVRLGKLENKLAYYLGGSVVILAVVDYVIRYFFK